MNCNALEIKLNDVVGKIRITRPEIREWFRELLQISRKTSDEFHEKHVLTLGAQRTKIQNRLDGLYMDKLDGTLSLERFRQLNADWSRKVQELDELIRIHKESGTQHIDIALKVFELSQTLPEKFVTFNSEKKRRLLEITCLNLTFDGVSVVPTYREPFDILAKGFSIPSGRGGGI